MLPRIAACVIEVSVRLGKVSDSTLFTSHRRMDFVWYVFCGLPVFCLSDYFFSSSSFFLTLSPHPAACEILVPGSGIEPAPSALETQSLKHRATGEVPGLYFQ